MAMRKAILPLRLASCAVSKPSAVVQMMPARPAWSNQQRTPFVAFCPFWRLTVWRLAVDRDYSKERLQLAATVRGAIKGLQCSSPNTANSALSHERDPMADKLLEAEEEAAAKGQRGPWSGYNPNHISLAFNEWSGKSELEVHVAIIIISCLLALAIGEFIERRRQRRFMTRLPASVHYGSEISEITVFDISSGGARLSALPSAKIGDRIALVLGEHRYQAEIKWLGQKCFGVKFDQRLDRFALMRLRGV